MPTLYRPKVVVYTLPDGSHRTPDGKRVTKHAPGAVRTVKKSPTWWGRYTDGEKKRHQARLSKSKEIAGRMLAKLAGDSQLASVGIRDPFAEHRDRPLAEQAEEFGRYLSGKGNTEGHVKKTVAHCLAVLEGIGADAFEDLQPSAVVEFLAGLRDKADERPPLEEGREWFTKAELVATVGVHPASVARLLRKDGLQGAGNGKARRYPRAVVAALRERLRPGVGVSTSNHYLTSVKGFTRWLVRDRRALLDPLACLSRMNADADLRVRRRALDPADFARLVEAARRARPFRSLSGADRAVIYPLAARAGLRASELASLSPASFDFDAPSVTVEAAYSKRRRKDVQPLPADAAELLRAYVAGRPAALPLWPGTWPEVGAEMVRLDLAAAGIAFLDADGLVYDFHALRHQFITDMVNAGVHPKDAQALARHSTITLTMDRYAHVRPANLHAALDRLAPLAEPAPPVKPAASRRKA